MRHMPHECEEEDGAIVIVTQQKYQGIETLQINPRDLFETSCAQIIYATILS